MAEQNILYTKEDGIGTVTFNRPERMNAVTQQMLGDLAVIVADIIRDNDVRAIIITGNGRAFCSGTDVANLGRGDEKVQREREERIRRREEIYRGLPESPFSLWTFTRIPKPTIAAVNGAAVGMGVEWVAQCDIRIASEDARFGWVFSRRGLTPDTGAGPYLLPYIVGLSKALELMYSGEIIDAREAEKIGLVSAVVPPDQLLPAAEKMARKLMQGAPLALKGIKELTYGSLEWPPSVHQRETRERFTSMNLTEDCREGIKSFREKRPPVWKGR
jgi:enoyl-CoA hydratase/carnithine racemase